MAIIKLELKDCKRALLFIKLAKKHAEMEDMCEVYCIMGDAHFANQNYKKALAKYNKSQKCINNFSIKLKIGLCYQKQNNDQQAEHFFKLAMT